MDPVSHVIVARSLECLRQRGPGERGQPLAAGLGALAPDVDAVLMATGWDRYLAAHEIGTHALVGAAACAALAAGVTRLVLRGSRYRALAPAAAVGATSHIVADLLSGAAIRIGWPLIDARVTNLGAFAMGDPFVVIAGAAAIIAWSTRPQSRRRVATPLLVVLALGIGAKAWTRHRALDTYRATPAAGAANGLVLVQPVWGSWSDWQVFDRTEETVRAWRASGGSTRDAHLAFSIPRLPSPDEVSASALARSYRWETVRNLLRAHDFTFATVARDRESGDTQVLWSDIRYCESPVACGIRAGGILSPAGQLRQLVLVGDWVQTR